MYYYGKYLTLPRIVRFLTIVHFSSGNLSLEQQFFRLFSLSYFIQHVFEPQTTSPCVYAVFRSNQQWEILRGISVYFFYNLIVYSLCISTFLLLVDCYDEFVLLDLFILHIAQA